MSNIGYIRVSSYSQNTDRQLVGVELEKIFEEKASAKTADRPQLKACIEWSREGDTLYVHSIDRLARNLQDLQNIIETLNGKGVFVNFHKEGLVFGGNENPMQKLMLQMLGAISEFERTLINERRKEGMAAAKAAGKQIGAKRKLSDEDVVVIKQRIAEGHTKKGLALEYGVSRQTLYSAVKV
ncbi:MAG: recombinase family protein [Candidatus Sedimenticola sp. (ex Thyasira tokunagai)]